MVHTRGGIEHDVLIRNAVVYDGSGRTPFRGDVAVDGERIVGVWHSTPFLAPHGRMTIDAEGAALAPGFIDTHSHADFSIGEARSVIEAENFLRQGVTTMVVGNCGRSAWSPQQLDTIVRSRGSSINIATLVGLNSVRTAVMRGSAAPASAQQIAQFVATVRVGMADGALGVSTGYAYVPGRFASEVEIVAQLRVAAAAGGVHATHIRDEGRVILPALEEVMTATAKAGVPLLVSHLKIAGLANCGTYRAMLERFRRYRDTTGPVYVDLYPYEASSTDLELYLPDSFLALPESARARVLMATPHVVTAGLLDRLRAEQLPDLSFARVASYFPKREWKGKTIREIDEELHPGRHSDAQSQSKVVVEMLKHGGAQMIYRNLCPEVLERIPQDLVCMIGSDSAIRYNDGRSLPHPRGWGTFPRVFQLLVRERKVLSIEEAVRRMTDVPARFFRLEDRGRIEPGYYADLVLFDPATIGDKATERDPFEPPVGIRYVLVNGAVAVGEIRRGWRGDVVEIGVTGEARGRFLRSSTRLVRAADGLLPTARYAANDIAPRPPKPLVARMVGID